MIQSARIEGQRVWLALLREREEWNAAPEWAQDEAIKAVAAQFDNNYKFQKTEIYECGGQRHRIGTFKHIPTGILFNLIPGGRFTMGSLEWADSQPLHEVIVKAFLMAVTPLTQAQWDGVGGVADERGARGETLPIEGVSWDDIQTWLAQAKIGGRLALPTEAEWEYVCRAGTKTAYSFGDNDASLEDYAWYDQNSGMTSKPVAGLKPNAFGLTDVHGNVWEWCQDNRHDNYNGAPTDGSAWTSGGDASGRVLRGGGWGSDAGLCRSAFRFWVSSSFRFSLFGFRLCLRLD